MTCYWITAKFELPNMAYRSPELSGGSKDPIQGHCEIYLQKGHKKDPKYGHQKISFGQEKIPFGTNKKILQRDKKDRII